MFHSSTLHCLARKHAHYQSWNMQTDLAEVKFLLLPRFSSGILEVDNALTSHQEWLWLFLCLFDRKHSMVHMKICSGSTGSYVDSNMQTQQFRPFLDRDWYRWHEQLKTCLLECQSCSLTLFWLGLVYSWIFFCRLLIQLVQMASECSPSEERHHQQLACMVVESFLQAMHMLWHVASIAL